jgi:endonuclease/exonuclease/phosphatase family metal-dependent hydrolase
LISENHDSGNVTRKNRIEISNLKIQDWDSVMRRLCLVFWLCLLPAAWAAPQVLLRVATFNVENYLDAGNSTRRGKSAASEARVRDSILALHPDVIALQEIGSSNALLQLEAGLKAGGLDLPFWELVTAYDTNIHLSVLSRFPIVSRRSHTNETFLLDGRRLEVKRGFADLEIQVNPRFRLTLIAAHLKSRVPSPVADEAEWRYQESLALRRAIDARLTDDPDLNLVVLGDFNDLQDSKPLRTILGRGKTRLFDTRPVERNGADDPDSRRITWTQYYSKEDVFARIDYILLSHAIEKLWVKSETYILASPDWGLASDHRALVAAFAIPGQ